MTPVGDTSDKFMALRRFEWVEASHFCSHGMDAKENSPRRARRTRRMEAGVKTGLLMNFN